VTGETDALLMAEIAARRDAPDAAARGDILSLLLQARHEDGAPMTDAELRDELITLLVAGHETTATALAWAFQLILERDDVRARLEAELEEAAAQGGGRIDPARLAGLEYLDAVVKETLRLRPILPIVVRLAKAPVTVGGWTIPAGVRLAPCIYLAHRRPESYPEPDRFRPERFLGAKVDPYTWLPFGGGIRRCIGIHFALFEMKVVLATVFSSARLRLAPGPAPTIRRRGITLAPSNGTRVVLESRRS
jgi:cytochrome P450